MARSKKGSTRPPGSYRHEQASRPNQPTTETAGLMPDQMRAPKEFTVQRVPQDVSAETATTDRQQEPSPRLAWERKGETSGNDGPHTFAGAPLYTREKINPLTMIEQLRKPNVGVPLNLFDDFNGLPPEAQKWEFYQHAGHWQNRLIHGDSSEAMQSLIARDGLAGQVQMIYFDPPYGIKFNSNFMVGTDKLETSNDAKGVPVGDTAPLKAFRDTYERDIHSYLDVTHERLVLFRELLAESGSLFVQIGDDNVHRLAVLCDEVFGEENRVATITWRPTGGSSAKTLPESASYLLWYAKDRERAKYRQLYDRLSRRDVIEHFSSYVAVERADGTVEKLTDAERVDPDGALEPGDRIFATMLLTSMGASNTGRTCNYEYNGVVYHSGDTRQWRVSTPAEWTHSNGTQARASGVLSPPNGGDGEVCGLDRLAQLGRLHGSGEGRSLRWKWYEEELPGRRIDNVWHRMMATSGKRYVVQTANSVIERCILMATDPGDLVLDPTCGAGTTPHMAERWGRRWIGIDVGRVAIAIARRHLLTTVHPWYETKDGGSDPGAGLKVETIQRVSAATLAYDTVNDPENTIELVDRPKEDRKRARLTGPFTVESSSPYTYLPFTAGPEASSDRATDIGAAAGEDAERLLEALTTNPICDSNGRPVLEVTETTPWPHGRLVSHEADCTVPRRETRLTAAIMLAAPDATVTADQVAAAAAEARQGRRDIDDLIIVAGAFEDAASTWAGPLRVHKVVGARDLQIPGLARKADSDAGALTLLGEPDVFCDRDDDGNLVVELAGFDTFDPATGGVRSSGGDDVDCWMIDTDHDGTGFFPRLVYLPGYNQKSPQIKNLLKSLGRDLHPDARDALCGLVSQPFPPPESGNTIAVKIITRAGTEMTTILDPPAPDPGES